MKTINSFRSKLLAFTLAITASVASFAYEFEYVNDFHIDGFGYKIISVNTPDDGEGYVSLIEIADCKKDVVIPKYVSYGDRGFHVTTFGMGSVVFTNEASSVVESITIPKTTSVINKNALAGCPNLKTVVVDSENPYYDSRENCNAIITTSQNPYFTPNTLIAGCKTTIIPNSVAEIGDNAFYNSALESITIPTGTTKIGRSAFNNSILLSSITLSATLIEIGNWAFDDCNNLKEVICYAPQPPTISKYTFSDISPTVYVPENTVTIYQNAPYWMTFDIQPINAGPFNEKLLGTWRVVGGNEIISISDSIIVFIGLTQKYTASATQLTVERLWIPEEESYRWANCNYTLSNDTLWIDNFMPLLVATYPPTFGPITLVKVKHEDLFPTLWGLRRTHTIEMYDYAPNDGKRSGGYPLSFAPVKDTIINGKTYLQFSDKLHELDYSLFFLREENNKVLIYSSILQDDLVLYDYTLEVGDSLYTIEGYDWFDDVNITKLKKTKDAYVVTDVSTITLSDGIERKKWSLYKGYTPLEYVEGIGCFGENLLSWSGDFFRLITNYPYIAESVGDHLVCVSKNGQLLYSMTKDEMNSFTWTCECLSEKDTTYYKSKWCDTWNVLELKYRYSSYTTKEDFETWRYYLAQDTLINNYTYTAVTRQTTKVPEGVYPFTIPEPEYVAAVRFTDDRKVYIYYDNTEYLLYDFNVQPGDELTVFAGINHYHSHHTNTIRVDEVERYPGIYPFGTEISLSVFPDFYGDERPTCFGVTKWVEGVGDLCGFITGADCGLSDEQSALLCAYKEGNQEYSTELEEYAEYGCEYNTASGEYTSTLAGLQRTTCLKNINENEVGTVWGSRSYLMQEIETATIDGKQYLLFGTNNTYDEYCSLWLREENNKILVYSSAQKIDLVLYDFTLNVGDSLPRLYVDEELSSIVDYYKYEADWEYTKPLFVTEVSTITLLDGKEYKKWTFDNGMEYVEGIGSFGTSYAWNDFYQLIANGPLYSDVFSQHLVCASKNGQLLYQMDDAEMEQLETECLCEIEPKWSETWCDQWNILSHGYQGPQDPLVAARTSIFWLSNNTVNRDGQEYIPLMCSSSKPDVESTNLIGELRFTEDKQVYFYYDNTEYLLYDFDVQVGDTLDIFGGIELYSYSFVEQKTYPHVITKIDTLDDGRLQITSDAIVIFEDGEVGTFEEKQQQIWIEGLGSINGIVHTGINPGIAGNSAIVMLCAYRDDECVYKTDSNDPYWIDYTQLGCVYNEGDFIEDAFPILSGLQRTVCNEYCGETEDDNSGNITYKQTFTSISFENNKPYILCNGYLLREEDNKIFLYSQSLNKDIVLYDFTLEVGDSLLTYIKDFDGTMYSDDTLVVTDISSVTLLDGKEYKKWTFDNGMEYVEGIGMYGGHRNGNFVGLIQELVVPCHTGTHLVCVSKNNKLLYQMDDAEMERLGAECLCDYDRGPRKDNAKNGKIGGRPTPTQWNMLEVETKELDGTPTILRAETFSYTLENDSIVTKGKTFYQLARQSTKDTAITKSFVGALHFGEDEDNRVYFLRDGIEYVLYDFTAEPGDTIEIFAGINNYPQETTYTHVVVDKDTTEDGACRMFLEVVFPDETTTATNEEKVWLAGLGSIDGIVHNAATRTSDAHAAPSRSASSETQTSVMLCAWREDSCLYTTNHPEYDTFGCVYNQDPTAIENLTSPTSYQKIIHEGTLLILHEGKVYNVIGIQIK